jgi:integrase-like protein
MIERLGVRRSEAPLAVLGLAAFVVGTSEPQTLLRWHTDGVPGLAADPRPAPLDRVVRVYVDHYNTERPHRALGRHSPLATQPPTPPPPQAAIERRDRLGGLLHEYHLAGA